MPGEVKICQILAMQLLRAKKKGCKLYAVKMENLEEHKEIDSEDGMANYRLE